MCSCLWFVYPSPVGHLVSFQFLALTDKLLRSLCTRVSRANAPFIWGKRLGVESGWVMLCVSLLSAASCFPKCSSCSAFPQQHGSRPARHGPPQRLRGQSLIPALLVDVWCRRIAVTYQRTRLHILGFIFS